mgnify:CR=1 FL=1
MDTEKHIRITGYSNISWKDAIVKSIEKAGKSLDHLSNMEIIKQRARVANGKIIEYIADLDIAFFVEDDPNDKNQNSDNM